MSSLDANSKACVKRSHGRSWPTSGAMCPLLLEIGSGIETSNLDPSYRFRWRAFDRRVAI